MNVAYAKRMKALFTRADEALTKIALSFSESDDRKFFWAEQAHRLLSPASLWTVSRHRFPLKHRGEWAKLLSAARHQAAQWKTSVVPAIERGAQPPSFKTFLSVAVFCKFVELRWEAESKIRSSSIPEDFPNVLCHAFYLDRLLASDRWLKLLIGKPIVGVSEQVLWSSHRQVMASLIGEANVVFSEEVGRHNLESADMTLKLIMQWTHHLSQTCRFCGSPMVKQWGIQDPEGKLHGDKHVVIYTMPEDTEPISNGRSGATEKYCADECRELAKRMKDGEAKKRERERKREQQT